MIPPANLEEIAERLRSAASAEVRPMAPVAGKDEAAAGKQLAAYLHGIAKSGADFAELAGRIARDVPLICDSEHFLSEEEITCLKRVLALFKESAPKFAAFRAPELDPFVRLFPDWFRPYNDSVTMLVRTLVDGGTTIAGRLAAEAAEEAADTAAFLAARNEPSEPWEEVKARLFPA